MSMGQTLGCNASLVRQPVLPGVHPVAAVCASLYASELLPPGPHMHANISRPCLPPR